MKSISLSLKFSLLLPKLEKISIKLLLLSQLILIACNNIDDPKKIYSKQESKAIPEEGVISQERAQNQGQSTNTSESESESESNSTTASTEESDPEMDKYPIVFTDPTSELFSNTTNYLVSWKSDIDSLSGYNYETKLCSDNACSMACTTSFFIEENSLEVFLEKSKSIHFCARVFEVATNKVGKWTASPSLTLDSNAEVLEISINDQAATILQSMLAGDQLGTLTVNSIAQDYSFTLTSGQDYFELSGDNNELVTLRTPLTDEITADLSMTVMITGIESSETTFNFSVEQAEANVVTNLIANGDFSDGTNSWNVVSANNTPIADTSGLIGENAGNNYINLSVTNAQDRVHFSQVVTLKANTTYTLRVRLSGINIAANSGPMVVDTNDVYDATAQFTLATSQDWTDYLGTFTTGPEQINLTIRLFQENSFIGQALYDDVRLEETVP